MDWISVKDRLPEADTWVLVAFANGPRQVQDNKYMYTDKDYGTQWLVMPEPLYWMPLPQPPTEGE
jgi:hypothetical protein